MAKKTVKALPKRKPDSILIKFVADTTGIKQAQKEILKLEKIIDRVQKKMNAVSSGRRK